MASGWPTSIGSRHYINRGWRGGGHHSPGSSRAASKPPSSPATMPSTLSKTSSSSSSSPSSSPKSLREQCSQSEKEVLRRICPKGYGSALERTLKLVKVKSRKQGFEFSFLKYTFLSFSRTIPKRKRLVGCGQNFLMSPKMSHLLTNGWL